jgi:hypothetical protein
VAICAVATPPVNENTPTLVDPVDKLTVPAGVLPEPEGFAVAVKVTDCPITDGFGEEVRVVVVGDEFGKTVVLMSTPTMLCSAAPVSQPLSAHAAVRTRSGRPSPSTSATAKAGVAPSE